MLFSIDCDALYLKKGRCALHLNYHFTAPVTLIQGPSGSGKTLLLRTLAGLEKPLSGRLHLQHQLLYAGGHQQENAWVPPHRRPIAYAFQDYRLMPHLTVYDNLALSGAPKADILAASTAYQLESLLGRYPLRLSGGEAQRVSLLRTLLQNAKVYLLDEPVSALDSAMRQRWLYWVRDFQHKQQVQLIYVTHHDAEREIWPEAPWLSMDIFQQAEFSPNRHRRTVDEVS